MVWVKLTLIHQRASQLQKWVLIYKAESTGTSGVVCLVKVKHSVPIQGLRTENTNYIASVWLWCASD